MPGWPLIVPPPFWWLLALSCLGQGIWAFCLGLAALRRGSTAHAAHGSAVWFFRFGTLAGLVYGWVQSDAVFVFGQACVLLLGERWIRAAPEREDQGKER
jgi:lipid-A-disaccharide synthase-like uncharacterized protein